MTGTTSGVRTGSVGPIITPGVCSSRSAVTTVPNGMGRAVDSSLSGFFDLAGEDEYAAVPGTGLGERRNGRTLVDPAGGLFQDR